jgi:hypothetical protein
MASVTRHTTEVDLLWAIEGLLEDGEIESGTPAYAIARQVAHQGFASLTASQQAIYNRVVIPALERRSAARGITSDG